MKSQCKGRTKAGKPCRAAATPGGLCFFHANPNKASELGRLGGRSRRHTAAPDNSDPLPTLDNATAVREAGARLFAEAYEGKIDIKIATGLTPLLSLQMLAIKAADFEQGLVKLDRRLRQLESTSNEPAVAADQDSDSNSDE